MRYRTLIVLLLTALHIAAAWQIRQRPQTQSLSEYLKYEPKQVELAEQEDLRWHYRGKDFVAEKKAAYQLFGLVMSQNNIRSISDIYHDRDSEDTKDLCLIWGSNIRNSVIAGMKIKNTSWTCWFDAKDKAIWNIFSPAALSNNHLVTDSQEIRDLIETINNYDQVYIEGYLVDYYNTQTPRQVRQTSLSRSDTDKTARGGGACEVFFVTKLKILGRANFFWNRYYDLSFYLLPITAFLLVIQFWFKIQPKYLKPPSKKNYSKY